jgi:hypothetical protein
VIVPDEADLLRNFPSPEALAAPLREPLERARSLLKTDFAADFNRVQTVLRNYQAPDLDRPDALFTGMLSPLSTLFETVRDSEVLHLLQQLAELFGVEELAQLPEQAGALLDRLQDVVVNQIGNVVLAVAAVSAAGTLTAKAERSVGMADGLFSANETEARLQRVLEFMGNGPTGLAAALRGMDPADSGQVQAVRERLHQANQAFLDYHMRLARDLAFSEVTLAALDTDALQSSFRSIHAMLLRVDLQRLAEIGNSLQRVLEQVKEALRFDGEMDLDRFREMVRSGLGQVKAEIDWLDLNAITRTIQEVAERIREPLQAIENFKVEVEALVRGAFQAVEDAVRQIDLAPVRQAFEQALGQVEAQITELEELFKSVRNTIETTLATAKSALEQVRNFILDPEGGLQKQINDLFASIHNLLNSIDIGAAVEQVQAAIQPVADELGHIEFAPVIDTTVDIIETIADVLNTVIPLLVTDSLRDELREAAAFLRDISFTDIGNTLEGIFDEIFKAIDEDALGRFKEEYDRVVSAIDEFDPQPALAALQEEIFAPLIAELEKIDLVGIFAPVQDAFDAARGAFDGFNPTASLEFITAFFEDLMGRLQGISPVALLQPIEDALADLRNQITSTLRIDDLMKLLNDGIALLDPILNGVNVTDLFDWLEPGMAAIRMAIEQFDLGRLAAPLAGLLRDAFAALGLDVDRFGMSALFAALQSTSAGLGRRFSELQRSLQDTSTQISRLDVRAALMALRPRYEELRAGLAVHGQVGEAQLSMELTALDPMPILSPFIARVERIQSSYAAKTAALDQMIGSILPTVTVVDNAVAAIGRLLSPVNLVAEILSNAVHGLLPQAGGGSFKEQLLRLVDALNPVQWRTELVAAVVSLQNKVRSLLGEGLLGPLRDTLTRIAGLVDLLDISALRAAVQGVFEQAMATLEQFNPAPVIQALDTAYRRILDLLDQLNPQAFITEIDRLYREDVLGVVRAISPEELLLPSLQKLFDDIHELLVDFDIDNMFRPILERLRELQEQLITGIDRASVAFEGLIDTLDLATGSSAQVSASVG